MYICLDCRKTFEEYEIRVKDADPLVGWNGSWVCPYCESDFIEEAERCGVCGEWHAQDDISFGGICRNCIAKKVDWAGALAADKAAGKTKTVEIPEFLAWVFERKIIDILEHFVANIEDANDLAQEYVADDAHDFVRWWNSESKGGESK